jgi:transposase-like protein
MLNGTISLRRPRLRGIAGRFESRVLPLFERRTNELGELLPELYLHGLALGDFELALRGLLGDGAPLSASSIARLKAPWQLEYDEWRQRRLDDRELVYVWVDGVYVKAGLEKEKACLLVVIGAFRDGHKELLALTSGYRESTESWIGVLRDLKARGLEAPKLAVADGALAFWAAAAAIWPETAGQRCWNHAIVNVLDKLPKTQQRQAKLLLCAMPYAATRAEAQRLRDGFARRYRADHPEAVAILAADWEALTTFYDFPEEHWKHIRTTNVVESPFAALRLRTGAAKRFKKVTNATMLIWRVLRVGESRFRRLDAPELLADVYDGRRFADGKPITRTSGKVA